jgi:hypothetical protein
MLDISKTHRHLDSFRKQQTVAVHRLCIQSHNRGYFPVFQIRVGGGIDVEYRVSISISISIPTPTCRAYVRSLLFRQKIGGGH